MLDDAHRGAPERRCRVRTRPPQPPGGQKDSRNRECTVRSGVAGESAGSPAALSAEPARATTSGKAHVAAQLACAAKRFIRCSSIPPPPCFAMDLALPRCAGEEPTMPLSTFTVLVVSFPRMSITFTTTLYSPGFRVAVRGLQRQRFVLARAERLPLVVERVAVVVPVDRPVVDPLRPVLDRPAHLLRHVVRRDDEIRQRQRRRSRLLRL